MTTEFAFELRANVDAPQEVGDTPAGRRRFIPIAGGTFAGPRLKGIVMPGGADAQVIRPDGVTDLVARYTLKTDDDTLIYVVNRGLRHGPVEVMQRLMRGEPVDPALYYFRTTPVFEVAAGPHDWLNRSIFVGIGARHAAEVHVRYYRVL
ncbi:MAG: DUF3237 domain-containing protein [Alphaproteobacteria bacterium]|nr:DUF3237 domain-containing protein [Alphaproteobacteria bacterium]